MNSDILDKVLAYIDANIHEKITLSDLSEIACYSPFYFSKLFSEIMGMPATGYIRIRKLQHAIVSLLEGQRIMDVALLYAFDSHEGFTRAFTQLFGSTPSTVKKRLVSYTVPAYVMPVITNRRITMEAASNNLQNNMHQLVFEILENSLEEARAGYCTKVEVLLLPDGEMKITDNGRGIPLSKDVHASKAVLDKILAGSPITNAEYSQMGDLAQAGLQTVNSLCEALQITVKRGGDKFQQNYVRGVAQHDLIVSDAECGVSGTEIVFKPDTAIFSDTKFSQEMVYDWLKDNTAGVDNFEFNLRIGL
ncbi:MAG: helix-turn-helix domain-containing protein [Defluviitaleaceae bacterium]|nr:helix-turn-helix domain-containing protein [Defluviitaleaceae bacterium]